MTSEPKKITDLIGKNKFSYSFEVTPDVKHEDIDHIDVEPVFISVTWHAKSHLCENLDIGPLKTASYLRKKNYQVLFHLSCDNLKKHYLERLLAALQEKGICNLFLILGESYDPNSSEFKSTVDLIKYIREISGQHFCIGVTGFCECNDEQLSKLKDKIDAGADFILTQAFFETKVYKTFVQKCSEASVNVPIMPGVFAFDTYSQLLKFTNMCKVKVSKDLMKYVQNTEGQVGKTVLANLITTTLSEFPATHFHFFTLNKIGNVCEIVKDIKCEKNM